jgi:hypothetical protein
MGKKKIYFQRSYQMMMMMKVIKLQDKQTDKMYQHYQMMKILLDNQEGMESKLLFYIDYFSMLKYTVKLV